MNSLRKGLEGIARSKAGSAMLTLALAFLVMPLADASARPEEFTSNGSPANTLVMPFDVTGNLATTLVVSHTLASPFNASLPVSTHWTFWAGRGPALEDVSICLVPGDTAVVDPRNLFSVGLTNEQIGPTIDLSGFRGFVTVTAYATDEDCSPGNITGFHMVNSVVIGSFSIRSGSTTILANGALGFESKSGENGIDFADLPDRELTINTFGGIDLQTLKPDTLSSSAVVFLALKERAGRVAWPNEIGPLDQRVSGRVSFTDALGVQTTLPDLGFRSTLFSRLKPGLGSLIPGTTVLSSAGLVHITDLKSGRSPDQQYIGRATWVAAFAGSTMAGASFQIVGKYF